LIFCLSNIIKLNYTKLIDVYPKFILILKTKTLNNTSQLNDKMGEIICKDCNLKMAKKGIIQSGNSKYNLFRCEECSSEQMQAISVNPTYHR